MFFYYEALRTRSVGPEKCPTCRNPAWASNRGKVEVFRKRQWSSGPRHPTIRRRPRGPARVPARSFPRPAGPAGFLYNLPEFNINRFHIPPPNFAFPRLVSCGRSFSRDRGSGNWVVGVLVRPPLIPAPPPDYNFTSQWEPEVIRGFLAASIAILRGGVCGANGDSPRRLGRPGDSCNPGRHPPRLAAPIIFCFRRRFQPAAEGPHAARWRLGSPSRFPARGRNRLFLPYISTGNRR